MHELSLASAIADIAADHARGRRVLAVEVRIGALRQVVPDALDFAFALVAEGTVLDGAGLVVEQVPARVACRECGLESDAPAFPLRCASCGSVNVDVTRGEELLVDAIELEEEAEAAFVGGRR